MNLKLLYVEVISGNIEILKNYETYLLIMQDYDQSIKEDLGISIMNSEAWYVENYEILMF